MMVEGVHFDVSFVTPFQLGFKILSVNVSDIYAMGGIPRHVLLDIALTKDADEGFIGAFFDGVRSGLERYRLVLVGGDLSASRSGVVLSATLGGYAKKPVFRSGARPGDRIYVTGNLGDSACGLELLKRIKRPLMIESGDITHKPLKWATMEPLVRRHLLPEARDPSSFAGRATSMIDISDGLFIDLSRICDESGVGARIYMEQLPLSPQMKKAASVLGLEPYSLAASGGEDYELLFTAPPRKRVEAFCIGEITVSGRVVVERDRSERTFGREGYIHWH